MILPKSVHSSLPVYFEVLGLIYIQEKDFAMKEFKDRPQRRGADFAQELKVLERLRSYPDEHIVTHLATWTLDDKYYMLFPYAQCNLRQYMKWMQFGTPNPDSIVWLLGQLRGLAGALRNIHNLSSTGLPTSSPSQVSNLRAPQVQMRESGWHHDLKPENILLYKQPGPERGTFKISDFGSSKIHTYRSGSINTRSPNGTLTYEPPEAKSELATSRPYDVWSLGCVFLELLIWANLGCRSVEEFASERMDRRYPDMPTEVLADDSFWQMYTDRKTIVRKSVLDWIEKLKKVVLRQRQQPFKEVLELIRLMLNPDPKTRIDALKLWNELDKIYKQKKVDLRNDTDETMPEGNSDQSLPRLSLDPKDRPSFQHNHNAGYVSIDFLTASPTDSRMQRRSSFGSETSPRSTSPLSRKHSLASSTTSIHGHHGSMDSHDDRMNESR